jgi:hypothetical protein
MKVILAALAGAAVTATGAALAGPTSRPVTQAQVAALTKRVAALEQRNTCLAAGYNAQRYEPYLVQQWDGFATKSGFVAVFMSPSLDDGLAQTGYVLTSPTILPSC